MRSCWSRIALKLANKLDRAKEAANTLFKQGKYQEAYDGYTEALEVDPLNDDSNAKVRATPVPSTLEGCCGV